MTAANTPIRPRRLRALRIELMALAMLLTALAIVLFTNAPPGKKNEVAQVAEPVQVLPALTSSSAVPRAVYPMLPAVVNDSEKFSKID